MTAGGHSEKLHIGHFNTNRGWGGGEHQVMLLMQGLRRQGVSSTLFAHPRGKLIATARAAGMTVHPLRGFASMVIPWPCLVPLSKKVGGLGIDILHLHDSRGLWIGSWMRRRTGIPAVLSRRIASPLRRNFISNMKYSGGNVQAVIAVSETVRDIFARSGYPDERIHVVTDGLDINELTGIEKDEPFRSRYGGTALIGGIGKLSVKKNWQLLVRVAAHLAKQGHDFRWLVFGDGPERGRLEELSRSLGVGDIVHFPGFKDDAGSLLKSFDVLFHPSLMEGASVTIRSAMVMGVPVVAVDAPASVESLAGCGWIVGGDDVPGAAASVLEAVSDEGKRREVCSGARASAVSRFSIEKTVRGTVDIYRSVLA